MSAYTLVWQISSLWVQQTTTLLLGVPSKFCEGKLRTGMDGDTLPLHNSQSGVNNLQTESLFYRS